MKVSSTRLVIYCGLLKLLAISVVYYTLKLDLPLNISDFIPLLNTFYYLLLAFAVYKLVREVSKQTTTGIEASLKFSYYGIIALIILEAVSHLINAVFQ